MSAQVANLPTEPRLPDAPDQHDGAFGAPQDLKQPWYPRHMRVDLRKLKPETLRRYCRVYGLHISPASTPYDLALSAGRHFEATLDVDEEDCLAEFCSVIKKKEDLPGKPISKAAATAAAAGYRGKPAKKSKRLQSRQARYQDALPGEDPSEADDGGGEGGEGYGYGRAAMPAGAGQDMDLGYRNAPMGRDDYDGQQAEYGGGDMEGDDQDDDDDDNEETHCYCKKGDFGEMIACDNADCPIEWFHLSCVGLSPSTRPGEDDKWYCPECRGSWGSSTKRFGATAKGPRVLKKPKKPMGAVMPAKGKRGRGY